MTRTRLPRWLTIVCAVLAAVLVPVGAFLAWIAVSLSGGLDDVLAFDRPTAQDARVVEAREQAADELGAELAEVLLALPPTPLLARASGDECAIGQHNWKIDDDFDLDCTAGTAVLLAGADDAAVDEALAAAGWAVDAETGTWSGEPGQRLPRVWTRGDARLLVQPVEPAVPPSVGYPLYSQTWEVPGGRAVAEQDLGRLVPGGGGTVLVLSTGYFRE